MDGFIVARNRWESIITQDDGFPAVSIASAVTGDNVATQLPPRVDDMYIAAKEESIDGVGGILGMAGPTALKFVDGKYVPVAGILQFDSADIRFMQQIGTCSIKLDHVPICCRYPTVR